MPKSAKQTLTNESPMKDTDTARDHEPVHYFKDQFGRYQVMRRAEADAIERSGKWMHGATLDVAAITIEPQPLLCEKLLAAHCRPGAALPGTRPAHWTTPRSITRERSDPKPGVIHWLLHGNCGNGYIRACDHVGAMSSSGLRSALFRHAVHSSRVCEGCVVAFNDHNR